VVNGSSTRRRRYREARPNSPAEELGQAARQGRLLTAVHEFEGGAVVIAAMSNEAVLLVLLGPTADLGSLLFDLRRHRANIAALA